MLLDNIQKTARPASGGGDSWLLPRTALRSPGSQLNVLAKILHIQAQIGRAAVDGVAPAKPAAVIDAGATWTARLADIARQLNFHSIHHRAQIQMLIRAQGIEPDFVDYIGTRYRRLG